MDPQRFDALVQTLSTAGTRRRVLQLVTGAMASLGGPFVLDRSTAAAKPRQKSPHAPAKPKPPTPTVSASPTHVGPRKRHHQKKCKPPCGECQTCVKKVCQPAPDGTTCASGTCAGGVCSGGGECKPPCGECQTCVKGVCQPAPDGTTCASGTCTGGACFGSGSGTCTVGDDGSVAVVVETQFQGQPLRLEEHTDPGHDTTRIAVTLGGDAVMQLETKLGDQGVIATATYGAAFQGVSQARFTTDGQTLTGTIDGRAINPLPVDAPIGQLTFADGAPPPDAQVDPDLAQAIQALFTQAEQQSGGCQSGAAAKRGPARGRRQGRVDLTLDCIKAQAECAGLLTGCLAAAVGVGATVCGILTLGICAPAAAGAGVAYCAYQVAKCARNAKYGSTCCPVRCGGDVDNLLGDDPRCCEANQTCLDPNSNRDCCGAGTVSCGGECCLTASCANGTCCKDPNGAFQTACGGQCCAPLSPCCGGSCCSGTCIGTSCCLYPNVECGGVCCQNLCCNNVCCAPGQICANNQCTTPDPCPNRCSDGQCCPQGQSCCFGAGCCPPDRPICCGDPANSGQGCVSVCLH